MGTTARPLSVAPSTCRRGGEILRITGGRPGDDVGTSGGHSPVILRATCSLHRPCTPPVDENSPSDLRQEGLSTLSTDPMTMTTLFISRKKTQEPIGPCASRLPSATRAPTTTGRAPGLVLARYPRTCRSRSLAASLLAEPTDARSRSS